MQRAEQVWTTQSVLGSGTHSEEHEYSLGNTRLTQPPPHRDAHAGCSAVIDINHMDL